MSKKQKAWDNKGANNPSRYLLIDTTPDQSVRFGVAYGRNLLHGASKTIRRESRNRILTALVSFIKSAEKKLGQISGVLVVTGPGQFTSVRTGIAIAQTLAFARQIPITGAKIDIWENHIPYIKRLKIEAPIKATYGQPPSITRPRTGTRHG